MLVAKPINTVHYDLSYFEPKLSKMIPGDITNLEIVKSFQFDIKKQLPQNCLLNLANGMFTKVAFYEFS